MEAWINSLQTALADIAQQMQVNAQQVQNVVHQQNQWLDVITANASGH